MASGTKVDTEATKELTGAAKAQHEARLEREGKGSKKLAPYPFRDGVVNENAAIRMIKMVIPLCPADPRPTILQRNGDEVPNPRYTGEENCQQISKINNHGRWDVAACEGRGHDPWYTVFRKTIVEDRVDERETLEDGSPNPDFGYVIQSRPRVKVERKLNVIQVSDNPRHSTRMEVPLALAKGCRFLEDFGIESPCEFRNCTRSVQIDTRFGKYCSERHARLIAADFKEIMLPVGGDPYSQEKALEVREQTLENINIRKGG